MWDTTGLHQSISLKGGWELASTSVIKQNYGGSRERRQEKKEENGREQNYLNLTTFHQCAVELFPGFLCVCAVLKCHKAKTLWYAAEVREVDGE